MTSQIREPFCPLYHEACAAEPWKSTQTAHAGLLFDKFANAWRENRKDGKHVFFEFDKGPAGKAGANDWINGFNRLVGDPTLLTEACRRQRQLIERMGGATLFVTNMDRFVTGMGREHPLENGFAWHHTLGVPYLPGSSLKGMLRAWLGETKGSIEGDKFKESDDFLLWFGNQSQIGRVVLFDMLPLEPPVLDVDVMTPHYGPYYQDRQTPGDWHNPMPITFLTVAASQSWQLGVALVDRTNTLEKGKLQKLAAVLLEAMDIMGVGAKVAVGYGHFIVDHDAQTQLDRDAETRRVAEHEARRMASEQAAFEASIANDSEPLRGLKRLRRTRDWQLSAADQNMTSALSQFAIENPDPPLDCIAWIRDLLESIPNYNGVWTDPDAMKGKKNDKPRFSSKSIRELVKQLNPKFR